jgi:hypothetical protein
VPPITKLSALTRIPPSVVPGTTQNMVCSSDAEGPNDAGSEARPDQRSVLVAPKAEDG